MVPHPDGLSEQGFLGDPEEHEDDFVVHARGKDDVVPGVRAPSRSFLREDTVGIWDRSPGLRGVR